MDQETETTPTTERIDAMSHEDLATDFLNLMGEIVVQDMDEPALQEWQARQVAA